VNKDFHQAYKTCDFSTVMSLVTCSYVSAVGATATGVADDRQ